MKRVLGLAFAIMVAFTTTSHADIIYDGLAGDGDIFNDGNYFSNVGGVISRLPAGTIVAGQGPGSPITLFSNVDVIYDAANLVGAAPAPETGNFELNIGTNNLVVAGLTLDTGVGGIQGSGTATFTGGASVLTQFFNGIAASISNSDLTFRGGGDPIVGSSIDLLDINSSLFFTNEVFENSTAGDFQSQHQSDVTFQGAPLNFGSDPFVIETGDNAVATAFNGALGVQIQGVPEPTTAGLLMFAGLGCLTRRSRR